MKLYSAKTPIIAREIINQLVNDGDIDVESHEEAELDIVSVLKEYLRMDREITERTKDLIESRGLQYGQFGKIKRAVAEEREFGLGEEGIIWICNQILETFMHSRFIEEVYSSDADMRKKMKILLRKHMMVDEEMDEEVRKRIKNLQEGTAHWDVEYSKVMNQIKRKRGFND